MSTKRLGYDPAKVASLPSSVTESFCGVGNPFSLGDPQPAQTRLTWDAVPDSTRSWRLRGWDRTVGSSGWT